MDRSTLADIPRPVTQHPTDRSAMWRLEPGEWRLFWIFLVLSLFAKGASVFPLVYAADDYGARANLPDLSFDGFLGQGRFISYAVCKYAGHLGVPPATASAFYGGLLIMATIWSGLVVCRLWAIRTHLFCSAVVVGIVCLHPFQAAFFTYKIGSLSGWIAQLTAFVAIYICSRNPWAFTASVVCLVISLGTYQTMALYAAVTLIIGLLVRWFTVREISGEHSWRAALLRDDYGFKLLALPVSAVLYVITNNVVLSLLKEKKSGWAETASAAEFPAKLIKALNFHFSLLMNKDWQPGLMNREPLNPTLIKRLLLIFLVVGVASVIVVAVRRYKEKKETFALTAPAIALLIIVASAFTATAPAIVGRWWWVGPRIISAYGYFWAGIFCVAYVACHRRLRMPIAALGCVAVLVFAAITNRVFSDQQRLNLRELAEVSRIVGKLESLPGYQNVTSVAVVGSLPLYTSPLVMWNGGGLNYPALATDWSKVHVINEVSGKRFKAPNQWQQQMAAEVYNRSTRWPDPGSIAITNTLAVICLPELKHAEKSAAEAGHSIP